jgi:hypothetical protein
VCGRPQTQPSRTPCTTVHHEPFNPLPTTPSVPTVLHHLHEQMKHPSSPVRAAWLLPLALGLALTVPAALAAKSCFIRPRGHHFSVEDAPKIDGPHGMKVAILHVSVSQALANGVRVQRPITSGWPLAPPVACTCLRAMRLAKSCARGDHCSCSHSAGGRLERKQGLRDRLASISPSQLLSASQVIPVAPGKIMLWRIY